MPGKSSLLFKEEDLGVARRRCLVSIMESYSNGQRSRTESDTDEIEEVICGDANWLKIDGR